MPDLLQLKIDGSEVRVPRGATVAAAIIASGNSGFRHSLSGEVRGPLCGMGICFECRVTINGVAHCRSCQVLCEEAMDVRTRE
jgi:D-hydroxyproline dehydrogenase subunit gamma